MSVQYLFSISGPRSTLYTKRVYSESFFLRFQVILEYIKSHITKKIENNIFVGMAHRFVKIYLKTI